jgi:4,5-DOPA dioxygenase extradiol
MRLPVLFVAHGNPMNALGRTRFAAFLRSWGPTWPEARADLVISAHWEEEPLAVTAAERPGTLHDFGGFPRELYTLRYPAPGDPALARRVVGLLGAAGLPCRLDEQRPLDHGTWAPLLQLRPAADVPVVQLALPAQAPLSRHVEIGRALTPLRDEGVLVLGSGNLVHNLRTADLSEETPPVQEWARDFDAWVRDRLDSGDVAALADFVARGPQARRAHPTLEHYAPLLVCCGAAGEQPVVSYPYEGFEHATLSLRCVRME